MVDLADLDVIGGSIGKSMADNFTGKGAVDNQLDREALEFGKEFILELNSEEDKNMGCTLVVDDSSIVPQLALKDFHMGDSTLSRKLVMMAKAKP